MTCDNGQSQRVSLAYGDRAYRTDTDKNGTHFWSKVVWFEGSFSIQAHALAAFEAL